MKKRFFAALLALALTLGLAAPAGVLITAEAAVSASDAQAYLDILNQTNPSSSYLVDFDGDGRDELVTTVNTYQGDPSNRAVRVYQGQKNLAFEGPDDGSDALPLGIYTKNGKSFLLVDEDPIMWGIYVFHTIQNEQWVQAAQFSAAPDYNGGADDATVYFMNDQKVTEEKYNAEKNSYQKVFDFDYTNGDVRSELEAILQAEALKDASPDEILAQIPYYGDRSKCKLTSEMAAEMAQFLDNWTPPSDYGVYNTFFGAQAWNGFRQNCFAFLCDVEGNGIPALVVMCKEGRYERYLRVYTWNNGTLIGTLDLDNRVDMLDEISFGRTKAGSHRWFTTFLHSGVISVEIYDIKNGKVEEGSDDFDLEESGFENSDYVEEEYEMDGVSLSALSSLLRAYAEAKKYPTYSYALAESGDKHYSDVTAAVSGQGTVQAIYKLLEDAYYVLLENQGAYTGAVVRGQREDGKPVWKVTQTDPEPAAEDALAQLVNRLAGSSNLKLDFSKLQSSPELDDLTAYLRELLKNIDGLAPNDPAKNDLAAFVDGAAAALASGSVNGKDNRLTLGEKAVADLVKRAREASGSLSGELREAGVELNKSLTPRVRVLWGNLDGEKACQLTFDQKLAQALDGCDLQVLLGDGRTYLQISAGNLRALTDELGQLSIQFQEEEGGSYAIRFLDGGGQVVERLSRPVTVGLPAPGELATIMASHTGGSDNWGGQYDPAAGAITFETAFSGSYEVLENNVAIDDVGELPEESREAISFMVSRGYMSAEDGLFRPADSLTRYEFTEALVGMFFALDRSLTTTFPDVPADSPYYAHVASAQARNIVNGYDDGTFGGEHIINREQVFALAARTLMDYKGYVAPADAEGYLSSFEDRGQLSGWAAQQVALSVREGVVDRDVRLAPQAEITREQAAVTLYRLFQLLYEVPSVALDVPEASSQGLPTPVIIGGCVAVAAAAAGGAAVLLRKKPKTGAEV